MRLIALKAKLQSRKEKIVSLVWLSNFMLDHPAAGKTKLKFQKKKKTVTRKFK
jgi:hypothetical protein